MFDETLHPPTRQVLEKLAPLPFLDGYYLAGGTALALHLGHRKSIDLDFFTRSFPNPARVVDCLAGLHPRVIQEATGTLDVVIDSVKVSFLEYTYDLLEGVQEYRGIHVAGILDIGCMKLAAVSSRGAKKDFVDLYFLLQEIALPDLLRQFARKYRGVEYSQTHLLKSLVYFADADADPAPDLLRDGDWPAMKAHLQATVEAFWQARINGG